ncbi:protein SRC2 [Brachypodium distachyon]|uniref:C2 domain-containing protein n=1 Tax=Brachypodium distachyon TaxID=15368 RepID=I1HFB6_BRADI|nr:protein SRC2 [Brachypodium distachyon]XP_024314991.1 protein SRC2 [Brachypodium distachyon]XP_024314992.1 protein SRC2 [Brachypodium distachyon]KQK04326.1 hypothetical protein BRADI_2g13000v3 [Brachypodium distachyon]PNT70499.1 hypothetical protein BRADI_2g13000v3 [Brachypodium distachyon]PNT70500.1 hypothetical protein BRADI_2g13000v3 [Brachypodium distachyon]|eukprot:XP_014753956.1 protein SRC2 [Brachypodium distachyon]
MAYRILEVTLISASDLKKVTFFSQIRIYAIASISGGDSRMLTHCTQVDRDGGRNPTWNAKFSFPIPPSVDIRGLALHVLLRAEATFFGHHDVGEIFVPLNDLQHGAVASNDLKTVTYQVRRPLTGRAHGVLYFCYKFTDIKAETVLAANVIKAKEDQYIKYAQDSGKAMAHVATYPESQAALAYPPIMSYCTPYGAYPPQPYGYGYTPSPYGYNAAPPPTIYGYTTPPMAAPARQRGGMGMGLGLGLLGGAVGGMMLGDMVGDFEADAAYDAGFNDGMSFKILQSGYERSMSL